MAGIRCFQSGAHFEEGVGLSLDKAESHHLVKVMRLREGASVSVLDGEGRVAECVVEVANAKQARLQIIAVNRFERPPCRIQLAQVIPKGKSMDAIVRKATEIGVDTIFPLMSEHSEVRFDAIRGKSKRAGWVTTAIEACKQCGSPYLPTIREPQSIETFFENLEASEDRGLFVGSLESGTRFLKDYLSEMETPLKEAIWLIGPEGDFSSDEYQRAREVGFNPVHLTENVLRSETAAIYALSILDYELRS